MQYDFCNKFITSFFSGTHLVHEILRMLITGKAEYHKGSKDDVWIEIQPYEKILKSQAKPRIINTHLALSWLPASFRYVVICALDMFKMNRICFGSLHARIVLGNFKADKISCEREQDRLLL